MKVNLLSAILNAFAGGYPAGQGPHASGWKALILFVLMILTGIISGTSAEKVFHALDKQSDHK